MEELKKNFDPVLRNIKRKKERARKNLENVPEAKQAWSNLISKFDNGNPYLGFSKNVSKDFNILLESLNWDKLLNNENIL